MTEKTKNNQAAEDKTVQQDAAPENKEVKKETKKEKAGAKKETKKSDKKSKKESPEEKIEALEQLVSQKDDQYLRLQAEFDNYRKRTLKEKMELTKSAGENILINVLPVMDDFERALRSMEEATEAGAVKDGLDLIYKRFSAFLKQNGIKEIEASEMDFDTDLHEALTKIPAPSEDLKGKVVDVIQKGYLLNDKVIRYAKVVIGE